LVQALTGDIVQARSHLDQAHELSRSKGDAFYQSLSSSLIGFLDNWRGDYDPAIAKTHEGVEVARTHNIPFALLEGPFGLGLSLTGRGAYERALSAFNEGLALAEKLGEEIYRNRFLNSIGWIHAECF
jgi:tetratricopeptide (TPR) repeat protein